jgi:hypothetical protein
MSLPFGPEVRRALASRIRYYNEMGIYDFYRRPSNLATQVIEEILVDQDRAVPPYISDSGEEMSPRKSAASATVVIEENLVDAIALHPEQSVTDRAKALKIRASARAVRSTGKDGSRSYLASAIQKRS